MIKIQIQRIIYFIIFVIAISICSFTYASESGTLIITGTPVEGIEEYGFRLYKNLREEENINDEITVWLMKKDDWKTELTLPYGKYYALVDDTAILPKDVNVPENCRYILRFGDSPFYETYEINENKKRDGEDKAPITLYLVSTVSGGAGSKVTDIESVMNAQEYIIGENEKALEYALEEIDKQESMEEKMHETGTEHEVETKEGSITIDKTENHSFHIIILILCITLVSVIIAILIYRKENEKNNK